MTEMTTTPIPVREYTVRNGEQRLSFTGRRLGHATSDDGERLRWLEVSIYKTTSGKYVAHRVGRTTVYHNDRCRWATDRGGRIREDLDRVTEASITERNLNACPNCNPLTTDQVLLAETDRHFAQVSEKPQGLVEGLTQVDREGAAYIPYIVLDAIREASTNDDTDALYEAFTHQRID